ncbi:MAG: HipA domain-containing protein, partial [Hydrogenophaga sp.]|nr:HipA domain-containing protein [Hydrogenophaga sp.]
IKGTTARLPGVALNEHFCMEVSRQAGIPIAQTEVSDDGQALVVHRFAVEDDGVTRKGMEDLCSLPSLDQAIEQARFSDVKPIAPTPQEKIGRSPCWGNAEGQLNCQVSRTGVERLAGAFQRH